MRKKKFIPRDFEKIGSSKLSATIYASMLEHPAFKGLSKNARLLYVYMKLQLYGQKAIAGKDETCFYFNTALIKKYGLYSNMERFRSDRQQLIDAGFIEVDEAGFNTRTKAVYRFSDKWQNRPP